MKAIYIDIFIEANEKVCTSDNTTTYVFYNISRFLTLGKYLADHINIAEIIRVPVLTLCLGKVSKESHISRPQNCFSLA